MPIKAIFIFLLFTSFVFATNDDAKELGKMQATVENLQKSYDKLENKVDELEKNKKSVEDYKNIIERQDKRLDDMSFKFSMLSLGIAILAIIAGWLGVSKVRRDAEESTRKWLEENAAEKIEDKLEKFDSSLDAKINEIEQKAKDRLQNTLDEVEKARETIKDIADMKGDIKKLANLEVAEKTISGALEYAIHRAESSNSYADWFDAAMLAYKQKNYQKAVDFFDKTFVLSKNDTSKAICLVNKALTLARIEGKSDEAIVIYDKVYEEFKASQNEEIRVQVVSALFNKGVTLGAFKTDEKSNEAIVIYDKVYEEFKASQNEKIKAIVASALFNKGVTLGAFRTDEKSNEAIVIYDKVYEEFKASQNEEIKAIVASALFNKGIFFGRQGKNKEAKELYMKVLEFNSSNVHAYANLFEAWLIDGDEFDNAITKQFLEYTKDNKQALLKYEMIVTVRDSSQQEQSTKIKELKDKFSDVDFGNWGWDELERWAEKLQDGGAKDRVKETIEIFRNWGK
jgi:tetratricopeptide (TPR) repeat protein